MSCPHCRRPVDAAACFCSACGHMLRRPPPGAPLAAAWRAWLGEDGDDALPAAESAPPTAPPPGAASLDDAIDALDDFDGPPLDPPEGFRETAWFLEAADPDALSEIEHDDAPLAERGARYRRDRAVVDEADRRAWSLAYDPEDDP